MPVSNEDHQALVLWAADCAEHVLALFERERPQDDRPRKALEAGRAWVRGDLKMTAARTAAFAAHAAAREADGEAARAAARAAGHAAATAHVPTHAPIAAKYAATAARHAAQGADTDRTKNKKILAERPPSRMKGKAACWANYTFQHTAFKP